MPCPVGNDPIVWGGVAGSRLVLKMVGGLDKKIGGDGDRWD